MSLINVFKPKCGTALLYFLTVIVKNHAEYSLAETARANA